MKRKAFLEALEERLEPPLKQVLGLGLAGWLAGC